MSTIKLHHPTGHPYWNKEEFKIEMPDGSFFDLDKIEDVPEYANYLLGRFSTAAHKIKISQHGICYQLCGASSGTGKKDYKEPFLIIDNSQYDDIEFVGEPLVISENLMNDLSENEIQ
jgi:hypothetical protein